MKAAIVGSLIALTAVSAQAQEEWIAVASAKSTEWHVKAGSGKLMKAGAFIVIERERNANATKYSLTAVWPSECLRGFGTMYSYDFNGNPLGKDSFVLTGTTVADVLASAYCGAALQMQSRDL
jgi:hypothetical protein